MSICKYENECSLPTDPNELKVLVCQLQREVEELIKSTEATLLAQNGKIAECCKYLKEHLSNSIKCLLADMEASGELDKIINDILLAVLNNTIIYLEKATDIEKSILQEGNVIQTLGYYKASDGGAALYRVKKQDSKDYIDNASIFKTKNGYVAEMIVKDNTIYSKQFGVVGDGVTDDSEKLQRFFEYKARKYVVNSGDVLLDKDIQIVHSDSEVEFVNSKLIRKANYLSKYYILNVLMAHDIVFKNLHLVGDRFEHKGTVGEWGHCINIVDSYNIKVENSIFENPWGDGIYIGYEYTVAPTNRVKDIEVINSKVINPSRNGISICSGDRIVVKDCFIIGETRTAPNSAIDVEPEHNDSSVPHLSDVLIENIYTSTKSGIVYMLNNYDVNSLIIRDCTSENEENSIVGYYSTGNSKITILNQLCKNVKKQAIVLYKMGENTNVDIINTQVIDNASSESNILVNSGLVIYVEDQDVHNINIDGLKVKSSKTKFGSAFNIYSSSDKKIYNLKLKNVETDSLIYLNTKIDYDTAEIKIDKKYIDNYYSINIGGNNFFANEIIVQKTSAFDTVRKINLLPDGEYTVKFLNRNGYSNYVDFTYYTNVYKDGVLFTEKKLKSNGDMGILKFTILKGDVHITEKIGTWITLS